MKRFLLLIFALTLILSGCTSAATVQNIDYKQAEKLIQQGNITVLDVRTEAEYNDGHIEGAILYPLQELLQGIDDRIDKNKKYLVYCRSGNRSREASKYLINNGFRNIYNLEHGILSWEGKIAH